MRWRVERTKEYEEWQATLTELEKRRAAGRIRILEKRGPDARRPLADTVDGSRHPNMKELRVGKTTRIFFAFDPRRVAVLLIGGDKAGRTRRFYRQMIPIADKIYDTHLQRITKGDSGGDQQN